MIQKRQWDKVEAVEGKEAGILTPLMGNISKVIKDIGNSGNMAAHGNQVDFNYHMVEGMFRPTNKIIEYFTYY